MVGAAGGDDAMGRAQLVLMGAVRWVGAAWSLLMFIHGLKMALQLFATSPLSLMSGRGVRGSS